MPPYYPVFLDIRGRRCVVIGGGELGEEKVDRLVDYGADTVVIAPQLTENLTGMAGRGEITWIDRGYRDGDLEGAFIAIVADASDSEVNEAVSAEAGERNVPLNVNDVTHLCTWIAPRRGQARRGDRRRLDWRRQPGTGSEAPRGARGDEPHRVTDTGSWSTPTSPHSSPTPEASSWATASEFGPTTGRPASATTWWTWPTKGGVKRPRLALIERLMVGAGCDCPGSLCKMWEDLAVNGPP